MVELINHTSNSIFRKNSLRRVFPNLVTYIFNAVADALQWIIRERGVEFVDHYLDDFVIVGRPGSKECADGMGTAIKVCEEVGAPVAPENWMDQSCVWRF